MAKYAGVTQWQVRQVWMAADLKPHRLRTFRISNDPEFAEKVVDVVGLYMNPPDNAVVLSVDEKTQIQALDRTQPMLPLRPGRIESRSHDYKRNGTASLYAAFDIATGKVVGRITKKHRAREFIAFLRQVDKTVDPALDLHLIVDNSSTHKTQEVKDFLADRPRIHFHFTPTSASWLVRRRFHSSTAKNRQQTWSTIAVQDSRLPLSAPKPPERPARQFDFGLPSVSADSEFSMFLFV